MKRNNILIYRDYGCMNLNSLTNSLKGYFGPKGYKIAFTDANEIISYNSLDNNVFAFFMPGGAGIPYELKLQGIGNNNIRKFVSNGGVYCGICAGAYYACKHTLFEVDIPEMAIKSDSGLDLINGNAIGSLYKELKIKPYSSNILSSTISKLRYKDNEEHYAYYSGGPYFDLNNHNENIDILANYEFKSDSKPAILQKNYGDGSVVISGVHYEISGSDLMHSVFKSHPEFNDIQKLANNLNNLENERLSLFNKIMLKLLEKER